VVFINPNDRALEEPSALGAGSALCRGLSAVLLTGTVVGIPYMIAKATIVQQGQIGFARYMNGQVRLLKPGFHLLGTLFAKVAKHDVTAQLIRNGTMTVVRVPPGKMGLAFDNGNPVLLRAGRHAINRPLFEFKQLVDITDRHIECGSTHIVTVAPDMVALCVVNGVGHVLEPGIHRVNNPSFKLMGFNSSTDEHIAVASKHRVIVPSGRLGLALEKGQPICLEPGEIYNIDSPTFEYRGSVDVSQRVITHGSLKVVIVQQGAVGIEYNGGVLNILAPGRHILPDPRQVFAGFLSTGQETLQISSVTSMTSDNVGVEFDAAVTIQVVDASKAVAMLAGDGPFSIKRVHGNILAKARLALSIIIGNNQLNASFKSSSRMSAAPGSDRAPAAEAEAEGDGSGNDPASFKQVVHDVFMKQFATSMHDDCGVHVSDMSIEDIRITQAELAKAMAKGAVARTELDKARVDMEVSRTKADSARIAEITAAEAQARSMQILADSEAARMKVLAQSEAERIAILAEAESDRIRKLDEANREVCDMTQSRELLRASGQVLEGAKATVVLGESMAALPGVFGGGRGLISTPASS
jgi:regulator of protease activity HflC (stomatin/prohibitin superfamily)